MLTRVYVIRTLRHPTTKALTNVIFKSEHSVWDKELFLEKIKERYENCEVRSVTKEEYEQA